MSLTSENNLAVRVANLFKRYKNGTQASCGIDFIAQKGEAVAVLGPNGAGKTTFLRQLTTELNPTSGTVEIFGIDAVKNAAQAKTLMGVTPQEAGVFETLTVREHLELFGKLKGLNKLTAQTETQEILSELGLVAEAKKQVGELSGGQRRRILIGLAVLGKPPMLVLDEPTTGLDPQSRRRVWLYLKKIIEGGTTVILSTHYLEEAEFLSHRIAFINKGKIIADGTMGELRELFPDKYRVSFLNTNSKIALPQVKFFSDFDSAQKFISDKQISEYQIGTASLEDVYFALVGERLTVLDDTEIK